MTTETTKTEMAAGAIAAPIIDLASLLAGKGIDAATLAALQTLISDQTLVASVNANAAKSAADKAKADKEAAILAAIEQIAKPDFDMTLNDLITLSMRNPIKIHIEAGVVHASRTDVRNLGRSKATTLDAAGNPVPNSRKPRTTAGNIRLTIGAESIIVAPDDRWIACLWAGANPRNPQANPANVQPCTLLRYIVPAFADCTLEEHMDELTPNVNLSTLTWVMESHARREPTFLAEMKKKHAARYPDLYAKDAPADVFMPTTMKEAAPLAPYVKPVIKPVAPEVKS